MYQAVRNLSVAIFIAIALLLPGLATAEPYFTGTRPLGMGGAYAAVADDADAMEYNPAGFTQKRYFGINFNYQRIELLDRDDDKLIKDRWHIALYDSKTSKYFGAGVSFTSDGFPNDTIKNNENYQALLSVSFPGGDFMFVGLSGKYIRFDKDDPQTEAGNLDVGLLFAPTTFLHIGLTGRNLIPQDHPELLPSELAAGISSSLYGFVTLAFDTTWSWDMPEGNQWNFHLGAEGLIAGMINIRGGYIFDEYRERDFYTVGLGYLNETGSIAYTFKHNPEKLQEYTHAIQLMLRF